MRVGLDIVAFVLALAYNAYSAGILVFGDLIFFLQAFTLFFFFFFKSLMTLMNHLRLLFAFYDFEVPARLSCSINPKAFLPLQCIDVNLKLST